MIIDRIKKAYKGGDRSSLVFKNIVNSIGIKGVGILISLLLIPMSISYVGAVEYGIWLTVSSVIGWMNWFDFGLGNGLRNKVTAEYSQNNFENVKLYVSSTYGILTIISASFFLFFLIIHQFVNWKEVFNVPDNFSQTINNIVVIVLLSFCAQFVLQLISNLLTAVHLTYKANLIMAFALVISIIGVVNLYYFTEGNLLLLVTVLAFAPVLSMLIFSIYYFRNDLKVLKPSFEKIDLKVAKSIMGVGSMFFLVQLGGLFLYQTSNIIIAKVLGLEEVSVYNVVHKYFMALYIVITVILNPYWTGFTEAFALKDFVWMKKAMGNLRKISALFIGMNLLCVVISPFVFDLWIGDRLEIPFSLTVFLSVYFLFFFWYNVHITIIYGVSKLKVQSIIIILCALINVPLSIFFGKIFGLNGVVLANTLILGILSIITSYQAHKIVYEKASGIWLK
jgi:O-antigen/teichoic acid export membrane protein